MTGMTGVTSAAYGLHDEAGYLVVNEQWRIIATDESGSITGELHPSSLLGQYAHEVIGPTAVAALETHGIATFTLDNAEYVLTATKFHLPAGTIRVVRAQEAQATLEHVLSVVVHELRNPLSAMRALVQGLEEEVSGVPESLSYTTRLTGEIDRLSRLLGSMAQVARLEPRPREHISSAEALERAAATFQRELEGRGIHLHMMVTPHAGTLYADADEIQQMLVNLITNAADAMPEGGTITLRTRLDQRGRPQIQVEDTGIGMTSEEIERALRPRQSSKPGGMGLGLMVVRGIVRQYGGQLRVSSIPRKGTTVSITFPEPPQDNENIT